jgi:hypothetical protein
MIASPYGTEQRIRWMTHRNHHETSNLNYNAKRFA